MAKAVYIHIPFCNQICTYCDFCKFYYNKKWVKEYFEALKREIKKTYKGEKITTLYVGGGTPSALDVSELKELFQIISSFNLSNAIEFTFECNSEDLTEEKLKILKKYKVNRLSIGVQTFNKTMLKTLNRKISLNNLKKAFTMFDNINLDLMYALPNQSLKDLKKDIDAALKLNPTHISLYSLIIEPNTVLYIKNQEELDENIQKHMYDCLCEKLSYNGYFHYEISNFCKSGYESKHNLTYWNNDEYYGFGLGAAGYINGIRYENTRSIKKYIDGDFILNKEKINKQRCMEDEFMLGFRKINGINKIDFNKKFNTHVTDIKIVNELIEKGYLKENEKQLFINPDYIYVSNEIIEKFIDCDLPVH